jgi:hypothetical protein
MSAMEALDAFPAVSEEQVIAALNERREEMAQLGGGTLPVDQFWQQGDLERYTAAHAWWPKDAPDNCALPTLRELCLTIGTGAGLTPVPFMDAVTLLWQRCVKWLEAEGRSTVRPNETKEERRRRQTRESAARTRQLAREAAVNPAAARVRELHGLYIAACQARKVAMQAAHDAHTPTVDAAKLAWEEAKRELSQS